MNETLAYVVEFVQCNRGTLAELLCSAYSRAEELVSRYHGEWEAFDSFVFNNLGFMNCCGFVSVYLDKPIGFISWDPRGLPGSVEIGHNCIVPAYQNMGLGKQQLGCALNRIDSLCPKRVVVKTGTSSFFLPARKMYESGGFSETRRIRTDNPAVQEVIEYERTVTG